MSAHDKAMQELEKMDVSNAKAALQQYLERVRPALDAAHAEAQARLEKRLAALKRLDAR